MADGYFCFWLGLFVVYYLGHNKHLLWLFKFHSTKRSSVTLWGESMVVTNLRSATLPFGIVLHYSAFSQFNLSGLVVILGLVRGELKDLWNYGTESPSQSRESFVEP